MVLRQAQPTFIRGTAIKITATLDIATATSATITIDDPSNTEKVSNANMTKDADKIYSYVYQTTTSLNSGIYVVTIKITQGDYVSIQQSKFELLKQEGSE